MDRADGYDLFETPSSQVEGILEVGAITDDFFRSLFFGFFAKGVVLESPLM